MQTSSRRAVIATTLAGLAGGCAPLAFAATPDAELMRLEAEFVQMRADHDAAEAHWHAAVDRAGTTETPSVQQMGGEIEDNCRLLEAAADRVMARAPVTLAGLTVWARMMLWRFDPSLTGIVGKPTGELAEFGVNEAYALAVAIERIAINAGRVS